MVIPVLFALSQQSAEELVRVSLVAESEVSCFLKETDEHANRYIRRYVRSRIVSGKKGLPLDVPGTRVEGDGLEHSNPTFLVSQSSIGPVNTGNASPVDKSGKRHTVIARMMDRSASCTFVG